MGTALVETLRGAVRFAGSRRGAPVTIRVDGVAIAAHDGETVATALLAVGLRAVRTSAIRREPRGPLCLMGTCQDCAVEIDGAIDLACQRFVRDGMVIALVDGAGA